MLGDPEASGRKGVPAGRAEGGWPRGLMGDGLEQWGSPEESGAVYGCCSCWALHLPASLDGSSVVA